MEHDLLATEYILGEFGRFYLKYVNPENCLHYLSTTQTNKSHEHLSTSPDLKMHEYLNVNKIHGGIADFRLVVFTIFGQV